MDASFNKLTAQRIRQGLTENFSPTFLSSGDPCLDFFFQVVRSTSTHVVAGLLAAAWNRDSLTALKLVCHLRAVRGAGKSDLNGFYASALWLHDNHPKTLTLNANTISGFGYLKDLLEILHRLVTGVREKPSRIIRPNYRKPKVKIRMEDAATVRRQKRESMAAEVARRYADDPHYRLLPDKSVDMFAALLSADLERLKSGDVKNFSLAAIWCPSLNYKYGRSTLLCEAFSSRLFPRESNSEYMAIEEHHYVYRVRDRLRREVLVPLRQALQLPEVYMSARQWVAVKYSFVASVATKNYKDIFLKHDEERFKEYVDKVGKSQDCCRCSPPPPDCILGPPM